MKFSSGLVALCLVLSGWATFLGAASYQVSVDVQSDRGELQHFWKTFGLGHASLLLREEGQWGEILKRQIQEAVTELGMNGVRQHGLLHDDMGVYREVHGQAVYDFTLLNQVFDFYLSLGIKPLVELGSMPRDLASDPSATNFQWKQGKSPPKDWQKWQDLVANFVQNLRQRYSAEEVDSWYFEVWNEPELEAFWSGTQQDYLKLYDHTVWGARSVSPNILVGGPTPSGPHQLTGATRLGENFINHVLQHRALGEPMALDFFSIHTWAFLYANIGGYFQTVDLLDRYNLDIPILITEAGPTWQFHLDPQPQETIQGATFVGHTVSELITRSLATGKRLPEVWSWWVLSDIFEESTYREEDPFIGCMGLVSRQGIKKPAYNAFKMLHMMGDRLINTQIDHQGSVHSFATKNAKGEVQILLANGRNPDGGPPQGRYYEVGGRDDVTIRLNGLGQHQYQIYKLDQQHGDAFSQWQRLGRPGWVQRLCSERSLGA